MKFKGTWILIAVFAALGAYFYFVEEPSHRAAQKAEEQKGLLFPGFDPDKVTEIAITGQNGKTRVKKGEEGTWFVVEPLEDRADDGRIRSLLSDLKVLKSDREIEGVASELQTYGLAKPQGVVSTQGAELTLAIGAENPAGDARYVRAGAGPVEIAKSSGVAGLLVEAKDLRSKDLLGFYPWSRLQELEVRPAGGAPFRLVKKDERWQMEEPFSAEADSEAMDALVEKLRWARANSFVDQDPAKVEKALSQGIAVTLKAEGEPSAETLRLAKVVGDGVWATAGSRKAVLAVGKDVYDAVLIKPEELRRRRPVLVKSWSADRIEISSAGSKLGYEREQGAWRREGIPVKGEESSALQQLLSSLESTKAAEVIDLPTKGADYGLASPKITLNLNDSRYKEQTLNLGEAGGKVYARAGNAGPVYAMPADYLGKVETLIKSRAEIQNLHQEADKR